MGERIVEYVVAGRRPVHDNQGSDVRVYAVSQRQFHKRRAGDHDMRGRHR